METSKAQGHRQNEVEGDANKGGEGELVEHSRGDKGLSCGWLWRGHH